MMVKWLVISLLVDGPVSQEKKICRTMTLSSPHKAVFLQRKKEDGKEGSGERGRRGEGKKRDIKIQMERDMSI